MPSDEFELVVSQHYESLYRFAYSLTGVLLEQLEMYAPEVMSTFHALAGTGCVEFLAETYYHSLSFLYSRQEFVEQVKKHG